MQLRHAYPRDTSPYQVNMYSNSVKLPKKQKQKHKKLKQEKKRSKKSKLYPEKTKL